MPNNYDIIAGQYDLLSRLVFGQAQIRAQADLLKFVKPGSRVLIAGGGTGWILERLADLHPSGLQITYVESSGKMIALARKKKRGDNEVFFVQLPVEAFVTEERYDHILTGFFFDNFSSGQVKAIFEQLHRLLRQGGHWLYTDFFYHKEQGRWWQAFLLRIMYLFFRWFCRVEGRALVDPVPLYIAAGYRQEYIAFYYGGFIRSIVYEKTR